jgi:ABC-2 type transport system ATP-binding protein
VSAGSERALVVEHVSKEYGRALPFARNAGPAPSRGPALSDVSFSVERGEMLGLLGANGAGKTTLLKIITTLLYPSSGRVLIDGLDVRADSARVRRMIGLVTCDERSFYWRLTGRQNLSFFGALYGLTKQQVVRRGGELLEMLGLSAAADERYQGYSSGMKQKLAIARGLLSDPAIVFYDEPTRSLDPLSAQHVREWIRQMRANSPQQTHVIATNQLSEAEQLCDRVLILARGRLIAQGTIREIKEAYHAEDHEIHQVTYGGPALDGVLKADPAAGLLEVEDGVADGAARTVTLRIARGSNALSAALEAILRSGRTILRCRVDEASFDEIFCSLVLEDHESGARRLPRVAP